MKKRILIAEDEKELHTLYGMLLGKEYEIIKAYNGKEAVDLYTKHRPDLTLMDIKMPVMPGDEAINKILDYDPMASIIAVTAYHYTREQLGVPILRKGFNKKKFMEAVKKGLKKKD